MILDSSAIVAIRRHSTSGIAPPTPLPSSLASHSSARGTTSRERTSNSPDTGLYRLSTNHRSMTAAVSSWPRLRAQMG